MKFSYNWLKEFVPALPKPGKLAELLTLHAFEVEALGKQGKDYVLDIAVLPNRIADASGHIGMAREIAAILGVKSDFNHPLRMDERMPQARSLLAVEVKTSLCLRYIARVLEHVTVKDSPPWIKERLEVCGIRSINNVVDATNYVMLETGQPLHAFDFIKIEGGTIMVRLAKKGEMITTLDGSTHTLAETMVVIADIKSPLALAGIKGGTKAEVTEKTKTIVLESATFEGPAVRAASQALGTRTDASMRFSVGLPAALAGDAIDRLSALIQELAGGEIRKGRIDIYPKKERARTVSLRTDYVNRLLGASLAERTMSDILKRLGFLVIQKKGALLATPPPWRKDIEREEDLIEEIGRIYGYENIAPTHPLGELVPPETNPKIFWQEKARGVLSGLGFHEVYNYSFVSEKTLRLLGDMPIDYLHVENPSRPEFAYLRKFLLAGLLGNIKENSAYADTLRFFELGNVFEKAVEKNTHKEKSSLGGVIAYNAPRKSGETFFELKGALTAFFERLGLFAWFDDEPPLGGAVFHPYRAARIKVDENELGIMGEIHPALRDALRLRGEIAMFEISADMLAAYANKEAEFAPISKYPSVMRDIALLVPFDTRVEEVLDVIENTGGELLIDTDLFDIYEGRELPDGKKNLAFRLIFQAHTRTLRDKEVDEIMARITKALEEANLEWEVRK